MSAFRSESSATARTLGAFAVLSLLAPRLQPPAPPPAAGGVEPGVTPGGGGGGAGAYQSQHSAGAYPPRGGLHHVGRDGATFSSAASEGCSPRREAERTLEGLS